MSRHNVVYYYKIGLGPTAAAENGGMRMRLISWNVNGLRACMGKGFDEFFHTVGADCFCLQETKLQHLNIQKKHRFVLYHFRLKY